MFFEQDAVDEDSAGEGVEDVIEMVGDEPTTIDSRDEELEATEGGVVMKAIAVLVNEEGEEEDTHPADSTGEHGYDVSTSGSPECGSTDLSHDHAGYPITALGVADESRDEDDGDFCTVGEHNWITCDFMDCKLTSDLAAVEGFIIEAVRYSSTLFLKQQQFSSVVYFLHRRRGKRELSSVGISACFKRYVFLQRGVRRVRSCLPSASTVGWRWVVCVGTLRDLTGDRGLLHPGLDF
eukprot:1427164-Rhodomonas_salina.1